MSTIGSRVGQACLACVFLLGTAGAALAQDDSDHPPFRPSNQELDQNLDQSLANEYSEDHPPPPGVDAPVKPSDRKIRFRLGMMGAYALSVLDDVEIAHREGTSGGLDVDLTDLDWDDDGDTADDDDDYDGDGSDGWIARAWIDLGKWVSLEGGYRRGEFFDRQVLSSTGISTFTYGETTFQNGQEVKLRVDVRVADLDLVLHPLNNKWVTIDLHVGARYVYWQNNIKRLAAPFAREDNTIEAVMPVVGVGLAIRPVKVLEIFARFRVGHLDYDRDEHFHIDDDGDVDRVEAKEKKATSAELDVGISLVLEETFGIVVGYRGDYLELERNVAERSERAEAAVHGLYAGLILQF